MRGAKYTFQLEVYLAPEAVLLLEHIPGVRARMAAVGNAGPPMVVCPIHAGPAVYELLQSWGLRHTVGQHWPNPLIEGTPAGLIIPPERIPGIKPETLRVLTEFQRKYLPIHQELRGGIANWVCGSGKTLFGLLWGLSAPGRILVITRSSTVPQWEAELRARFDGHAMACLYGQAPYEVHRVEPPSVWRTETYTEERSTVEKTHRVVFEGEDLDRRLTFLGVRSDFERWRATGKGAKALESLGVLAGVQVERRHLESLERRVRVREGNVVWRVWSNDGDRYVSEYESESAAIGDVERRGLFLDVPPTTRIISVGWAVLAKRRNALLHWGAPTVLVDESHRGKDPSRFEAIIQPDGAVNYRPKESASAAAMTLCRPAARVLALTATPMTDRVRDLYAQVDLYDPGGFSQKFRVFSDRYCAGHENAHGYYDSSGSSRIPELQQRVAMFTTRVTKSEAHAALPKVGREILRLQPKELGRNVRGAGKRTNKVPTAGGKAGLTEARAQLAAEAKREFLAKRALDYAVEDGLKVCVFTGRHESCESLGRTIGERLEAVNAKRQEQKQAPVQLWVSHGGTHDARSRQQFVANEIYPHPGPAILVGTMDAFSEAINGLHDTDRVLVGYLPWNLILEQFEGRFSRLGSKRRCLIEYVAAAHTIDEPILELILGKVADVTAVIPSEVLEDIAKVLSGETKEEATRERFLEKLLAAADEAEAGWMDLLHRRETEVHGVPLEALDTDDAEEVTPEDSGDEDDM